jgi:hypothetical protein
VRKPARSPIGCPGTHIPGHRGRPRDAAGTLQGLWPRASPFARLRAARAAADWRIGNPSRHRKPLMSFKSSRACCIVLRGLRPASRGICICLCRRISGAPEISPTAVPDRPRDHGDPPRGYLHRVDRPSSSHQQKGDAGDAFDVTAYLPALRACVGDDMVDASLCVTSPILRAFHTSPCFSE